MQMVSSTRTHPAGTLRRKEKEPDHPPFDAIHTIVLQCSSSLAFSISRSLVCFCTDSEQICRWHSTSSSRVSLSLGMPAEVK